MAVDKLTAAQDAVFARLKASDIPNVFETSVPPGFKLPVATSGRHYPYVLVTFGGLSPIRNSLKGIVSTRNDLKSTSVAVQSVGDTQRDTRVVSALVRDLLEGYSPSPDWGELEEQLSGDYTVRVPDYDLWPVRYATEIVFNTNANAVT